MLHSKVNGIDVLTVEGEITIKNIEGFKQLMASFVEKGDTFLILDLSEVSYLNSSALGVIAESSMNAIRGEKRFVAVVTNSSIKDIFKIVKFDTFMEFFQSKEEAIVYLNKKAE